jgi:hypothetical protein
MKFVQERSSIRCSFLLTAYDWSTIVFYALWIAFLSFVIYNFLRSCLRRREGFTSSSRPPRPPSASGFHSGGGFRGWFPGGTDNADAPPPYSKNNPSEPWRPGFWTGAALGGIATQLFNRRQPEPRPAEPGPAPYDWEGYRAVPSFFRARPAPAPAREDRGEGSSNLGATRRSTGLGGSNVR